MVLLDLRVKLELRAIQVVPRETGVLRVIMAWMVLRDRKVSQMVIKVL